MCGQKKTSRGIPSKLHSATQDITERKRIEEAMRESNKSFTQMADNIQEVFWMYDNLQQRIIYISPAYKRLWGRAVADVYQDSRHYTEAIHPDDRGNYAGHAGTSDPRRKNHRGIPRGAAQWLYPLDLRPFLPYCG